MLVAFNSFAPILIISRLKVRLVIFWFLQLNVILQTKKRVISLNNEITLFSLVNS